MDDGDYELDHLLHALREGAHLGQAVLVQTDPVKQLVRARLGLGPGEALQAAEIPYGLEYARAGGQPGLLWQVAHFLQRPQGGLRAEQRHRAAIRVDDPQSHADSRGLPRAVGSQKPEDLPRLDREGDPVHHRPRAKGLSQGVDSQCPHAYLQLSSEPP